MHAEVKLACELATGEDGEKFCQARPENASLSEFFGFAHAEAFLRPPREPARWLKLHFVHFIRISRLKFVNNLLSLLLAVPVVVMNCLAQRPKCPFKVSRMP